MTIYTLNSRLMMVERKIHDLYCYIKNNPGGGGEPLFLASPAYTITYEDIANWNAGGAIPNLQQVSDVGNVTDRFLQTQSAMIANYFMFDDLNGHQSQIFAPVTDSRGWQMPDKSGVVALLSDIPTVTQDTLNDVVLRGNYSSKPITFLSGGLGVYGQIGINPNTYSFFWGDMNPTQTGLYNLSLCYGALQKLTTGEYNIGIGVFAGKEITTGKNNTMFGVLTGQKTTTGNHNSFFGRQAGNENTTGYKNVYFGTYAGYNNLTSNLNVLIGYKAGNQTPMGDRNLFLGSFAGQGVTGANNLILGIGAGNGDGAISNKLIIHNNTSLTGYGPEDNQEGILGTPTQGNLANALITGDFAARWVKLNGYLQIGAAYMPNAQGDATYTKNIVAKADGTFGWENKATPIIMPKVDIIEYTQDATNYIIKVSVSNTTGTGYSSTPTLFDIGIVGANSIYATGVSAYADSNTGYAAVPNPAGGVLAGFGMFTITFPKSSNTSPLWNNPDVAVTVSWRGTDNSDGGASSPYNPRRISTDTKLIRHVRPKLIDNYEKFTRVQDVTYTSDTTNYYIDGRLNVATQGEFPTNNSFQLSQFYFNNTLITGTGITMVNTSPGQFITSAPVVDVNGNPTTMGFVSIPFRITIPKATNGSPGYNNGGNSTVLTFVLAYTSFSSGTHVPLYIPYSIPATFTSPSAIVATTMNASALPNAQGDGTYVRQLVQKNDGTIGYLTIDNGPQVIRTSAGTYILTPTKKTILMTFTGSGTIFNLPLVAPNVGTIIILYNGGTGDVVITGNASDGNVVIDGGMMTPSTNLTPGSPMTIFNDGVNWITKP